MSGFDKKSADWILCPVVYPDLHNGRCRRLMARESKVKLFEKISASCQFPLSRFRIDRDLYDVGG